MSPKMTRDLAHRFTYMRQVVSLVLTPAIALSGCTGGGDPPVSGDLPAVGIWTQGIGLAPDPTAKPYINYFEKRSDVSESWNYQDWPLDPATHHGGTRTIQIAAKTLVLDDADTSHLVERFNDLLDVKELDLYAETIIVKRPIHVPGATVRIHAEELRFEDVGDRLSVIDTSPIVKTSRAAPGIAGVDGLRAGDVYVAAKTFVSSGNRAPRFVLNGGAGQQGGVGASGSPGSHVSLLSAQAPALVACAASGISGPLGSDGNGGVVFTAPRVTLAELQNQTIGLADIFPTDGTPGTAGGKAGSGGSAGNLHSIGAASLATFMQARAGAAAANAGTFAGGAAGTPVQAVKLASATCTTFKVCPAGEIRTGGPCPFGASGTQIQRLVVSGVERRTSFGGAETSSPPSDRGAGEAGRASVEDGAFAWLHPHALTMRIAFAEDSFAADFRDLAQADLEKIDGQLSALTAAPSWAALTTDDQTLFTQDALRVRSMLNQLHSHEDFYGNPQAWVPELSLEANVALYEQEVAWAIRTIFVVDWLTDQNNQAKDKTAALSTAKSQLQTEIAELQVKFDDAMAKIPGLKEDAANAGFELDDLQRQLQDMETLLTARAAQNVADRNKLPFWKKALKVLFVVARALPVPQVQPALGAAASELEALVNFDSDHPWEALKQVPDVVTAFKNTHLHEKAKDVKDQTAAQKPETKTKKSDLKTAVAAVQQYVGPVITALKQQKASFQDAEVKQEEVDKQVAAELAKLKESDANFQDIESQLKRVSDSRAQLVKSIEETTAALEQAATTMSQHWLEVSELLPQLEGAGDVVVSQRTELALGELRQKAHQRLKKYQYLLARSYEYRMLKKYPGDLTLTGMFDEILTLVRSSSTGGPTASQYDALFALYRDDISKIVEDVVDAYSNGQRRYDTISVGYDLSAAELARLNAGQAVAFDFWERGAFRDTDEDVRIVKFEIDSIRADQTGSAPFAFFDIETDHEGTSRVWRDGAVNVFKHYNKQSLQPLHWTTRWENGVITQHQPSASSESLLRSLLPGTGADILLFSRPAAWATLNMRKISHGDGVSFTVRAAHVKLTYDFTSRVTGRSWRQYRDTQNALIDPVYQSLLHRPGAAAELQSSRLLLDLGYPVSQLPGIVSQSNTQEYNEARVTDVYQELYTRAATSDERAFWASELMDGRGLEQVTSYAQLITDTFTEIFGRGPTYDELRLYTDILDGGIQL